MVLPFDTLLYYCIITVLSVKTSAVNKNRPHERSRELGQGVPACSPTEREFHAHGRTHA